MNAFVGLAKALRHAPGLHRLEAMWNRLRPAYLRTIDPFGRGVVLSLGGRRIRVPAELLGCHPNWSKYEFEALAALGDWLERTPGSLTLLDVGCSFGVVTTFAVQVCPRVQVIAIDSDLVSLRAIEAVVPPSAQHRLRRVDGLLGAEHRSGQCLDAAVAATLRRLPAIQPRQAIAKTRFLCLDDVTAENRPHHQLDGLLNGIGFPGRVLLKCDVEGAELLVLRGATEFLERTRPTLLLSVHPPALPHYGHRPEDVARFLSLRGYSWQVLARDHEEHWWCEPAPR